MRDVVFAVAEGMCRPQEMELLEEGEGCGFDILIDLVVQGR
jgi:hypothetical protein